jgi:tRNA(Ser,Leu) C12 N-acetylase TAN1
MEKPKHEMARLIVTTRGLEQARRLKSAIRNAIAGTRVRTTGFRGIFSVEAPGDVLELLKAVHRGCSESIGHVTAVIETTESSPATIKQAAVRIGAAQIAAQESFFFQLHKRGSHGLEQDTPFVEQEIGGAIRAALEAKYTDAPNVKLKDPDIMVIAEILGPVAAVGLARRDWRD